MKSQGILFLPEGGHTGAWQSGWGKTTGKAPGKTDQRLGIAIDGGKDSLSMAVRVGNTTVKAPGKTAETGDSHRSGQKFL